MATTNDQIRQALSLYRNTLATIQLDREKHPQNTLSAQLYGMEQTCAAPLNHIWKQATLLNSEQIMQTMVVAIVDSFNPNQTCAKEDVELLLRSLNNFQNEVMLERPVSVHGLLNTLLNSCLTAYQDMNSA